jgi:hypothetical protein
MDAPLRCRVYHTEAISSVSMLVGMADSELVVGLQAWRRCQALACCLRLGEVYPLQFMCFSSHNGLGPMSSDMFISVWVSRSPPFRPSTSPFRPIDSAAVNGYHFMAVLRSYVSINSSSLASSARIDQPHSAVYTELQFVMPVHVYSTIHTRTLTRSMRLLSLQLQKYIPVM